MNPSEQDVKVVIKYVASSQQFEEGFPRSATVGQVKVAALNFFGLQEGGNDDGNTVTYTLFYNRQPLENLNQTLNEIAGEKPSLQMNLVQQITQG